MKFDTLKRDQSFSYDAECRMSRGPRVLWVVPGSAEPTSMPFAKRQYAALQKAGCDVQEFYISVWRSFAVFCGELRRLRRKIRQSNPDLVHAQFGTMTALMCSLASWKPLVITYQGTDLNPCYGYNKLRIGLGHLISRICALRASRIVCVSRGLRDRLWWRRTRATVIPTPINLNQFAPVPKEEARAVLGWGNEYVVLFSYGRDPVSKGLRFAQEAAKVAGRLIGQVRLVTFDGSLDPDAMPLYMNGADCLLVASAWEGSPNVVKEAMACNLPVVSTRVGDVEARLEGVFPSIITARDGVSLGQALAVVLALGRRSNGRQALAGLSAERLTEVLLEVYESAVRTAGSSLRT